MIALVSILIVSFVLGLIFIIPRVSTKVSTIIVLAFAFCATISLAVVEPRMHKPISMSVVEYLIKINADGTMTTTKQTTTTELGKVK